MNRQHENEPVLAPSMLPSRLYTSKCSNCFPAIPQSRQQALQFHATKTAIQFAWLQDIIAGENIPKLLKSCVEVTEEILEQFLWSVYAVIQPRK